MRVCGSAERGKVRSQKRTTERQQCVQMGESAERGEASKRLYNQIRCK